MGDQRKEALGNFILHLRFSDFRFLTTTIPLDNKKLVSVRVVPCFVLAKEPHQFSVYTIAHVITSQARTTHVHQST